MLSSNDGIVYMNINNVIQVIASKTGECQACVELLDFVIILRIGKKI